MGGAGEPGEVLCHLATGTLCPGGLAGLEVSAGWGPASLSANHPASTSTMGFGEQENPPRSGRRYGPSPALGSPSLVGRAWLAIPSISGDSGRCPQTVPRALPALHPGLGSLGVQRPSWGERWDAVPTVLSETTGVPCPTCSPGCGTEQAPRPTCREWTRGKAPHSPGAQEEGLA